MKAEIISFERLRMLGSRDGFFELYFKECGKCETYRQAFERVNDEHENTFGRPRYSDYNSFRHQRDRWLKRR
jgi:hypothetical protein